MPSGCQFMDFEQVFLGDVDECIDVTQGIHEIFVFDWLIPRNLRLDGFFTDMQVGWITAQYVQIPIVTLNKLKPGSTSPI